MNILFLFIGLAIGAAAAWFIFKYKNESTFSKLEERNSFLSETIERHQKELEMERNNVRELEKELAKDNADYQNLQAKLNEQKASMEELQERFKMEFKNIANDLLEDKSKKFTEQNKLNLDNILNPLRENLEKFKQTVEETYVKGTRERSALAEQIKGLTDLNEKMTREATNLTKAIKGDSKVQGGMGEIILERILERSGLTKGREYFVQESFTNEDGRRRQPDVVVKLPEGKNIIIDSKMALTDYERYFSAESDTDREQALKNHVQSIRRHVKLLSEKNYQNLYQVSSLDFVLMFIPIEPAFGIAVHHDNDIFSDAFEKNIVIVSTSTLLATLRTISSIWRQEYQNQNALEIARQSGALYDKFKGMVDDLIKVGQKMNSAKECYEDSMKKLYTGSGNLISRVEQLKKLGAKTSKALPEELVNRAQDKEQLKLMD